MVVLNYIDITDSRFCFSHSDDLACWDGEVGEYSL